MATVPIISAVGSPKISQGAQVDYRVVRVFGLAVALHEVLINHQLVPLVATLQVHIETQCYLLELSIASQDLMELQQLQLIAIV
jgi:hypothetical protein